MAKLLYHDLSYQVIGICFKVHSTLGAALPEHCYHHALEMELLKADLMFTSNQRLYVYYDNAQVGHFYTDIIVDNKIILELKSDERITSRHESQLFTYLHSTGLRVGYIVNFGTSHLQFKRLIL